MSILVKIYQSLCSIFFSFSNIDLQEKIQQKDILKKKLSPFPNPLQKPRVVRPTYCSSSRSPAIETC